MVFEKHLADKQHQRSQIDRKTEKKLFNRPGKSDHNCVYNCLMKCDIKSAIPASCS